MTELYELPVEVQNYIYDRKDEIMHYLQVLINDRFPDEDAPWNNKKGILVDEQAWHEADKAARMEADEAVEKALIKDYKQYVRHVKAYPDNDDIPDSIEIDFEELAYQVYADAIRRCY